MYDKENGKPRGYAFIEYENERDMHCKLCSDISPIVCSRVI